MDLCAWLSCTKINTNEISSPKITFLAEMMTIFKIFLSYGMFFKNKVYVDSVLMRFINDDKVLRPTGEGEVT